MKPQMHPRRHRPERLDVPRTVRELYPLARTRARIDVISPGEVQLDDRPTRRWRRGLFSLLTLVIALPLALVSDMP
jgi:hypothetical protein